jgi:hypothetical protein
MGCVTYERLLATWSSSSGSAFDTSALDLRLTTVRKLESGSLSSPVAA